MILQRQQSAFAGSESRRAHNENIAGFNSQAAWKPTRTYATHETEIAFFVVVIICAVLSNNIRFFPSPSSLLSVET